MDQVDERRATSTVLLADADVLIDYRESGLSVLKLVGRMAVLTPILNEVRGLTPEKCVELGIEIVAVETEQMLRAANIEPSVSFNDCLCLVVCSEEGWVCVTNDGALRRVCKRHGVEVRYGLGLMVDLVAVGALTRARAETVARRMQAANPHHINDRVISGFLKAVDKKPSNPARDASQRKRDS